MPDPLPVSAFLRFEFRQSTRLQMFLHGKDSSKGFGKTEAVATLAMLQANLAAGALAVVAVDWPGVLAIAERLSAISFLQRALAQAEKPGEDIHMHYSY